MLKYKKEVISLGIILISCLLLFVIIKSCFFKENQLDEPITNVLEYYNGFEKEPRLAQATTKVHNYEYNSYTIAIIKDNTEEIEEETNEFDLPYEIAPIIVDDGSIIYEGMTVTELTNKLNKSLGSYLTNTGYFFAKYTKDTGINPYLSVAIVLLETGCKWGCSTITVECNNIGGMKGTNKCGNREYSQYETLEEGIEAYLNNIYYNYYLLGLDTPEKMSSKYAASSTWASKVNIYIKEIRAK